MKVAIAGYGMEGEANYHYWSKDSNNEVIIFDQKQPARTTPIGVPVILGEDAFSNVNGFDLVVRTASLAPSKIRTDGKIWSSTNEFFAKCPARIIGVTGTKGKGTTSSLIASIFKAAGYRVWLVGNIGTPAIDILDEILPDDIVVFELSSFQLWDLERSPSIAVVLPIEPEHLDIHKDFEDYVNAKANICKYQRETDTVVYHGGSEVSTGIAMSAGSEHISYSVNGGEGAYVDGDMFMLKGEEVAGVDTLRIVGAHNQENACAAITVAKLAGVDNKSIAQGLRDFQGLPFRLEYIRTIKGADYYNDSFSSSLPATLAAVSAFDNQKIVVIGGIDRGADFDSFVDHIASVQTIKEFVLIGKVRHKLAEVLKNRNIEAQVTVLDADNMRDIVNYLDLRADYGDVVLFSPGYASFDMFKDFYDRGVKFTDEVMNLPENDPTFVFNDYSFDESKYKATFTYRFTNRREVFTESVDFARSDITYDEDALDRALFLAFLVTGVSYYKTFPTRNIEFASANHRIDQWQADFLNQVYQEGLSQFAYENNLKREDLALFKPSSNSEQDSNHIDISDDILSLQSGGKDSLLVASLLNASGNNFSSWYVTNSTVHPEVLSSLTGSELLLATRHIDRESLESAKKDGSLNGHVPVTFILQTFAVIQAILSDKGRIVVSIAHEGEEPHTHTGDLPVNHQWSKTWRAEELFREYVDKYVASNLKIGSPIRQYTELRVAELFVKHAWDKYSKSFSSCNKANYRQGADNRKLTWCGECPKCANTYLLFAPFVEASELNSLFNDQDMFAKGILQDTFKGLLGIDGVMKPFECIGEVDELRLAYHMAQERGGYEKLNFDIPESNFDYMREYDSQAWAKDLVKS